MKSFSGDEGYQAPHSPWLIEQKSHIANFVVCIPLVSSVLSGGVQLGCSAKEKKTKNSRMNNQLLLSGYFRMFSAMRVFCFRCFFGQEPVWSCRSRDMKKTLTRDLLSFMPFQQEHRGEGEKKKACTWATLHLNTLPAFTAFFVQHVQVQLWAITAFSCNYCQPSTHHTHWLLCRSHLGSRELFPRRRPPSVTLGKPQRRTASHLVWRR